MKRIASSTMERLSVLKDVDIFCNLAFEHLILLSRACTVVTTGTDQVIFSEGDTADGLYVVMEGRVQVYREQAGARVVFVEGRRSSVFGEMGVFDANPRSAAVRTLEPSVLLKLSRQDFQDFLYNYPQVAMECVRLLSHRVREMDERLQKALAPQAPLAAPRTQVFRPAPPAATGGGLS